MTVIVSLDLMNLMLTSADPEGGHGKEEENTGSAVGRWTGCDVTAAECGGGVKNRG